MEQKKKASWIYDSIQIPPFMETAMLFHRSLSKSLMQKLNRVHGFLCQMVFLSINMYLLYDYFMINY